MQKWPISKYSMGRQKLLDGMQVVYQTKDEECGSKEVGAMSLIIYTERINRYLNSRVCSEQQDIFKTESEKKM